jgi:hypothetical protein
MRQSNLAPVGRNQKLIFYKTEGMVDSAVDIDMGGIFTHGRFYIEGNSERTFLQFFSILWYLSIRDSRPVGNDSLPYEISHHREDKKMKLLRKHTKHETYACCISVAYAHNPFSHLKKAIVSILPPFSSDGSGFAYLLPKGFE